MTSTPLLSTLTGAQLSRSCRKRETNMDTGKEENMQGEGEWKREPRRSEERRESGRYEGEGYRHALVPLNWSMNTSHKTRLTPYTSSLHVKGRLYCPGLTAHLTCLDWKKGDISVPVSPLTPSLSLTNQLAGHFFCKYNFFTLVLNSEQAALGCFIFSLREKTVHSSYFCVCSGFEPQEWPCSFNAGLMYVSGHCATGLITLRKYC